MRLFVAFALPEDVRRAVAEKVAPMIEELPDARWVAAENLHLTLQFIGEREEEEAKALVSALAPVFEEYEPFSLGLGGSGSFPGNRPKVVWLGLDGPSRLAQLQRQVSQVSGEGQHRDRGRRGGWPRPFRPHLTLARCGRGWRRADVERMSKGLSSLRGRSFSIRHGTLFESVLTPRGARYSENRLFPLHGVDG